MSWGDEESDWVPTDLTPVQLDRLLDRNSFLIEKWNKMMAWHKAQHDWYKELHTREEARAVMQARTATTAKYAAAADPAVELARTRMLIALAQMGICERRLHALEKEAINLALRNKLLGALYNNGGGSY